MTEKLEIPCSYQGGKQRLAKQIVDILYAENEINDETKFYDLCCGSGTTCVAAKELGRNYLGCDISERAIEITQQRLK